MKDLKNLRVAINCDWLTARGWAEKVILDIVSIFPNADIFTSIFKKDNFPELKGKKVYTSYLQSLPGFIRKHTLLFPLYPKAFESFDFSEYDVVISSSHNLSKWIITWTNTLHICYCHTPVRALWSDHLMYKKDPRYKLLPKFLIKNILHKTRIFDYVSAQRVDYFLSNSNYVWKRIKNFYWRDSKTIYPAWYNKPSSNYKKIKWEYFLSISRFVPTKKNEILIKVFNQIPEKNLKIYWQWSEFSRLKAMVKWNNIEVIKWHSDSSSMLEREEVMSKAIAFLHPQKEDFWITPIEAQAHWIPVIAFWEWWALETVIDWKTWLFHKTQDIDDISKIIYQFDENCFKKDDLINNAERFSFKAFKKAVEKFVLEKIN